MILDRVVTFLLTKNPDASIAFYRDLLGLEFLRDDGFALIFNLHGTMLRISKVPDFTPAGHTVLGWEVADIAATVAQLNARGIEFVRYHYMQQDASGVCTFPTGDKVAWFKDPDENVLSLSQHAPS